MSVNDFTPRSSAYRANAPLPVPIRAYGGRGDGNITRAHLDGWAEQTTALFAVREFPGGHFYLNEAAEDVGRALAEDLR